MTADSFGTRETSLDRISVTGIRGFGHHGVLDHERRDGQNFIVDIDLGTRVDQAAAVDDLDLTIDYSVVASQALALIEGTPRDLIETVADQIARACLRHGGVQVARVTVHKPEAPVGVPFSDVSVTVTRWR